MRATRYKTRPWATQSDNDAIRVMLRDRYRIQGPPSYPSASDFDFWLATTRNAAVPHEIQLWFDGADLAGYVWPAAGEVDFITHPSAADIVPEMFAWAESRVSATAPEAGLHKAWCFESDAQTAALLTAAGYHRSEDFVAGHVRAMPAPLPDALPLPEGYAVRSLRGPEEVEARVAAHMAAFPDWTMVPANYLRAMANATYRLDLDIVATAPNGDIVATTIVWYDPALRMALFEPIGCHTGHQKQGLATGCIVEGLRRLASLDVTAAVVCGWRDDSDGSRLYRKLGFREAERHYVWERPLAHLVAQAQP